MVLAVAEGGASDGILRVADRILSVDGRDLKRRRCAARLYGPLASMGPLVRRDPSSNGTVSDWRLDWSRCTPSIAKWASMDDTVCRMGPRQTRAVSRQW